MELLKLSVTNFGPYTITQAVDFEEFHAAVVGGPNEAGKSTFFIDAPLFALNGEVRKSVDGVINDTADEAVVNLTFRHASTTFKIERKARRGKTQELKLYELKDENTLDLSDRLATNTQKKIDEILGFSHDLLVSTAIAQQDEINKLSTMKPSEREKIITEMLALGIWEKKKKVVLEKLNDLKKSEDQIDALELQLEVVIGNIDQLTIKKTTVEETLTPLQVQRHLLSNQLSELEQRLQSREKYTGLHTRSVEITAKIEQRQQRLTQLKTAQDPAFIQGKILEIGADIQECDILIKDIERAQVLISQHLKETENNLQIALNRQTDRGRFSLLDEVPCKGLDIHEVCKLLADARTTKNQYQTYTNSIVHIAPTVDLYIEKLKELIAKNVLEIASFNTNRKDLDQRRTDNLLRKQEFEQAIKDAEEAKRLRAEINHWSGELRVVQNELDSIPRVNTDELISTRIRVTELDQQINGLRIEMSSICNSLMSLNKFKDDSVIRLTELADVKKKVASYRTLLQAYTDIPTLLFTDVIPYIENYINEILIGVSPERRVQLRAYRETKAGTLTKALDVIGTTQTGTRDFEDLSGSAKFRQSLALRVALAKINTQLYNTQIGFFILDEGLGSLDAINTILVKNTLRKVAKDFNLFIIISHIPEFEDTFDTRILVNAKSQIQILSQKSSSEVSLDV